MKQVHRSITVIGAGITGCSVAFELAELGFAVTLLERNPEPLQGMSKAGFGSLTPFSDPYFTGKAQDFAAYGVELYRKNWIERLAKFSSTRIGFRDLGLIKLLQSDRDVQKAESHAKILRESGYRAKLLTVKQTRLLEPQLKGQFVGSLWLDEPWIDKEEYFRALAYCVTNNPKITTSFGTVVSKIECQKHHVVVVTKKSGSNTNRIMSDRLVVCTGLSELGIRGVPSIPLKWIRGDAVSVYTSGGKPLLKRHVYLRDGFITPQFSNRLLLGATYVDEGFCPETHAVENRNRIELQQFIKLIRSNQRILPAISKCDVGEVWRGWRPTPLDELPVIGFLEEYHRVLLATGFIGLGITMAPATAKCIAECCSREESASLPIEFDPQRFSR